MNIAVASGKGGTGKTTVAVSLALSLASAPLFLDCDVEEPNAHLFLRPTIERREEVAIPVPAVEEARCTGCGRCAEVCQFHAIAVVKAKVLVFPELCHGCGGCSLACPEKAISELPHVIGFVEEGMAGPIRFAHGILNVGEPMPGPIIRRLKKQARGFSGPVILDAPPGTACPVVETMHGTDFTLLVTEPTPFGLHDLKLAVEVAKHELGIPVGVLVNRDGIGDRRVDDYCAANGLPILMRIPFDRRIAEAYAGGVPLVRALPEYRERFASLYNQILTGHRAQVESRL